MNSIKKGGLFLIVLLLVGGYFIFFKEKEEYLFQGEYIYYSKNREKPKFEIIFNDSKENHEIYRISFASRPFMNYSTKIYGLVFLPKSIKEGKEIPGIVLLPGGGGTKEQESRLAEIIANRGYAVLTIDQRGIGETGGYYLSFEQDYSFVSRGIEPIQHLSVYDVLRSYDVLKSIKGVDSENIGLVGESMGARYAIIAAAIEEDINGLIVISSSGFGIKKNSAEPANNFLLSIDPDHYINKISPRPIVMIHAKNDSVVKLENAKETFELAKDPKDFYLVDNLSCNHGYCDAMKEYLDEGLRIVFGK